MSKAEEAALVAYPKKYAKAEFPDGQVIEFEGREQQREIFIEGYKKAQEEIIDYIKKCIKTSFMGKRIYCVDIQALESVLGEE